MVSSLIYFVVTLILTIALAPRPPNAKAASISDFSLPTADQGRSIPVVFGTVDITGSNCVWYGDLRTDSIRQHSLFTSTVTGFNYYLGFHLVLGHGPFDSVNKVRWDQKLTWRGNPSGGSVVPLTASGSACMDWLNLYGGNVGGQGGTRGCFNIRMGTPTETPDSYLSGKLGVVPAHRGVVSAIWINAQVTNDFTQADFSIKNETALCGYIGTSPYIKAVAFEVTRILQGWNTAGGCWYPGKAVINHAQNFTNPPTWSPSFQAATNNTVSAGTSTMTFDNTVPQNFAVDTTGFIHIGTEWIRIISMQTASVGGSVVLTGFFNVQRGLFGTTPASYPANTQYYVYLANVNSTLAMNAAHVVYQCLTDPRWGMGLDISLIDDAAFRVAADTFFAENMGLCMQWVNASTVEDFLKIVLNHCAASLVLVNATGLYQLVPIRGGYNPALLPLYDENTIKSMDEFTTQGWADEVNEVVLVYTDPSSVTDTAIIGQDISNLDVQGKVVSTTVNYQGLRDHLLAADVLGRELSARCTPLKKVKFTINRAAWATANGGLFKLNWAARNVTGLICRVTAVDKGKLDDNSITIDAVQDIYSLGLANYQISTSSPKATPSVPPPAAPVNKGPSVTSSTLTAPPTAPLDGDRYIVPPGATGAWTGKSGNMAIWDAPTNAWVFLPIPVGVLIYDNSTGNYMAGAPGNTVVNSGLSGNVAALSVTYDDSVSNLGVSNVQAAIQLLASNLGSAINLVGYALNTWYGATFDGSLFTTTDGINWNSQTSTNQTSFNQLTWVPALNAYFALNGSQVGKSSTTNVFGNWTYTTVGAGAWQGLRWFPALGRFSIWAGSTVMTSVDGVAWANPSIAPAYAATVAADSPVFWARLGDNAGNPNLDSGSGVNNPRFAPGVGVPGAGTSQVGGVISSGLATAFTGITYVEPRTSANGVVNLLAGTGAFSIEVWVQKFQTAPSLGLTLFSQARLNTSAGGYDNTVALTCYSTDAFKLKLVTKTYNAGTGLLDTGMTLQSAAPVVLWDGSPHHVVATRDGAGGAALYVDGAQVALVAGAVVDNVDGSTQAAGDIFGGQFNNNAAGGNSILDECALYTTSLTSTRVLAHYTAGVSGIRSNFSITEMLYDATNSRLLVFGSLVDTTAGSPRYQPQVYSSTDNLGTLTLLSNLSAAPATDNLRVAAVASQAANAGLPVGHTNLGLINTYSPLVSAYFTKVYAVVTYGGQFYVWGQTPAGGYSGVVFSSTWAYIGLIATQSGIPQTWTGGIVKIALSGTNVYVETFQSGVPSFNLQVLDLTVQSYTRWVPPAPPFAVTPSGSVFIGVLFGYGNNTAIYNAALSSSTTNFPPSGFVGYPAHWSGGFTYTSNGWCAAGNLNWYLSVSPGASSTGTNGFGWWPVTGATNLNLVESPAGTTILDALAYGTYLYAVTKNISTGAYGLIRYLESTMAIDGSFTPPSIVGPPSGTSLSSWFYVEGTFLSVAGVYGVVVDLTTESAPVYYQNSLLGVALNDNLNAARIRYSLNQGATWASATFSPPVQSPPHGVDCLSHDGTQFIATGKGWSGVSITLTAAWTFSSGASGIPTQDILTALYPNGLGTTAGTVAVFGAGTAGAAFSGTLVGTTAGLVWTLGPKVKATAAQVSYNAAGTDMPSTDVQSAITNLGGTWNAIKQQIFGS